MDTRNAYVVHTLHLKGEEKGGREGGREGGRVGARINKIMLILFSSPLLPPLPFLPPSLPPPHTILPMWRLPLLRTRRPFPRT